MRRGSPLTSNRPRFSPHRDTIDTCAEGKMILKRAVVISLALVVLVPARSAAAEVVSEGSIDTGFHAGAGLYIRQPIVSDETDLVPELELGVIIAGRVDLFLAVGLDVEHETFEDQNRESSSTAGALMTGLGLRVIVGEPRPGSAFFYFGVSATPVFGLSSYKSEGDDGDDEYHEDRTREYLDRFDIGVLLGVEYLVAASFGIGVESGFVTSLNNLKQTNEQEPDKHLRVGFFVPFLIRAAYHF
jgi:hypothetical protein